jgi:hypothetical protein
VTFVDLSKYPEFFQALRNGFETDEIYPVESSRTKLFRGGSPLEVVTVGSFDASFVPTPKDFVRLDERFRLPDGTWEKLGNYADFGFVVFKLRRGDARVHPMAFRFASAHPEVLFFPTVHVHDGKVHARAKFDHDLYCQVPRTGVRALASWNESDLPASRFVDLTKAKGLILRDRHVFRHGIYGQQANKDQALAIA